MVYDAIYLLLWGIVIDVGDVEICVVLSLEGQEKLFVPVFLEQFVARTIDAYWQLLNLL